MIEHVGAIERWAEADLEFHLAIARATQNPFLGILLEPLVDRIRAVIVEGFLVPGAVERGLEAHKQILDCLRQHDSEKAYRTISDHLRDSENSIHLFGSKT